MATSSTGASGATRAVPLSIGGLRWSGDRDGRELQYLDVGTSQWVTVSSGNEVAADDAAASGASGASGATGASGA